MVLSSTIHSIYFTFGAFHFSEVLFLLDWLLEDNAVPEKQEQQKAKNVVLQVILLIWLCQIIFQNAYLVAH